MIEPRRWIDEDATHEERRLLLSARDDGPTRGSREKMFVALGIGGAAALGTVAATATATQLSAAGPALTSTGVAAALTKAVPGGAGISAIAIMKWVGVGAIAGLVTTGSANMVGRAVDAREASAAARANQAPDERNSRTSAVYAPAALVAPETPAEPAAIEPPEPAAPPPPAEPAPAAVTQKASLPKLAVNPPAPNVGKEVSTLDRAREALAVGDAPSALEALGQHESEFASGALGPEAELLRIQALIARREHNSAAVMARGFLMKNPKSPHVGRVRALLAQAKSAEAPTESTE
jgi:hypothetical protein